METKIRYLAKASIFAAALTVTAQGAVPVLAAGDGGGQGSARYDAYLAQEPAMLERLAKANKIESDQTAVADTVFSDVPEYAPGEGADVGQAPSQPSFDEVWQFGPDAVQHNRGR